MRNTKINQLFWCMVACMAVASSTPVAAGDDGPGDIAPLQIQTDATLRTDHLDRPLPFDSAKATEATAVLPPEVLANRRAAPHKTTATLISDGFEGNFPGSTWELWHPPSDVANVDWGKSSYRKASGTYSIWCAAGGADSPGAGGNVPANTQAWVIAGPFDLSSASSATLSFDLWLSTELNYDNFKWLASLDGSSFSGLQTSTSTSGFQRVDQDLSDFGSADNVLGNSQVWIGFIYESDGSNLYEGAYLDNVSVTSDGGGGGSCGTYVITEDNDNNSYTGTADGDWGDCLFNDDPLHPIEFHVDINEASASTAQLLLLCNDVDEDTDPSNPEIDKVYVNDTYVGSLTGADGQDSTTLLNVPVSSLIIGRNAVRIDVNQSPTSSPDDWCVELKQAQLIIDGGCAGSTTCRSVSTDRATYAAGDTVRVTYEIDTSQTSQNIRVESNLLSPDGIIVVGVDNTYVTNGSANDAKTVNLSLPSTAVAGTYSVQVLVFDVATGQLDSSCPSRTFTVTGGSSCTVTCSATVPATAQVGATVTLRGSATASGCSTVEHFWFPDSNNTATIFDSTATWVYDSPGTYTWSYVVIADDQRCEKTGTIVVSGGGGNTCTYSYWVAVASRANGANNSLWRTSLGLLDRGPTAANVEIRFYGSNRYWSRSTTVNPNWQVNYQDIVGWIDPNLTGSGALRICSSQPLAVSSRTYNKISTTAVCFPGGTLGQSIDGFFTTDGISAGATAVISNLAEKAEFRSNIGYTNTGTSNASLTVRLYNASGSQVGTYNVNLAPGQWIQTNRPFYNNAGFSNLYAGSATVTVNSGSGIFVYGSVVDNVSNDPTTIWMR